MAARARKEDRYGSLLYDLKCTGLVVDLIPVEIGCLGHFMPKTLIVATACCVLKRIIRSLFEQWDLVDLFAIFVSYVSKRILFVLPGHLH